VLNSQPSDLILLTRQQLVDFARVVSRASADEAAEKVLTILQAEGRLKPQEVTTIAVGPLVVDLAGHEASIDGERLQTPPREFALLAALARHAGQVLTRDKLLELVHPDPGAANSDRTIDVSVLRLRKALGEQGGMIETIHGSGYKLSRPQSGQRAIEGGELAQRQEARVIGEFVQDAGVERLRTKDGRRYEVLNLEADQDERRQEAALSVDAVTHQTREPTYPTLTKEELVDFARTVGLESADQAAANVLGSLKPEERLKPRAVTTIAVGPLVVDLAGHEATIESERLQLKPKEFALLAVLARHAGQVLSRPRLVELIYPDPGAVKDDRIIDVHIIRLRKALGEHAALVETRHGLGYKLARPESERRHEARVIGEFVQEAGIATLRAEDGRTYDIVPKRYPLVAEIDRNGQLQKAAIMLDATDRETGELKFLAQFIGADEMESLAQAGRLQLEPGFEASSLTRGRGHDSRLEAEPLQDALEQRRSASRRLR
jgi:DNA-binding response OmpR family regulator